MLASSIYSAGLWLFHRNPLAPQSDIDRMKALAKSLGIDTGRLEPVEHKGCKYEGADPSPAAPAAAAAGTRANGASSSGSGNAGGSSSSNAQSSGAKKLVGSAAVAAGGCKQHWLGWLLVHGKGC